MPAEADLAKVSGPGIDLVADDPNQARELLADAYEQLDVAEQAKVKATTIEPLRKRVEAGLDRLYGVVPVASTTRFTFKPAEGADPIDLRGLVRGPDGAPYVARSLDPIGLSHRPQGQEGHARRPVRQEGRRRRPSPRRGSSGSARPRTC